MYVRIFVNHHDNHMDSLVCHFHPKESGLCVRNFQYLD